MSQPKDIKLYYFDAAGRAEVVRTILKYAKIPFEDIRIPAADWPKKKPTFPFKHVPVLEVDGVYISESLAIIRYVAKLANLIPEDAVQAARVDSVMHVLGDVATDVVPWIKAPAEKKEDVGKQCWEAASQRLVLLDQYIQGSMKNGYVAAGKLSAADIMLYTTLKLLEALPAPVAEDVKTKFPNLHMVMQTAAKDV